MLQAIGTALAASPPPCWVWHLFGHLFGRL
ncbi:hypothetical protein ABH935_000491 [Catenulispora sp. GAS73]